MELCSDLDKGIIRDLRKAGHRRVMAKDSTLLHRKEIKEIIRGADTEVPADRVPDNLMDERVVCCP